MTPEVDKAITDDNGDRTIVRIASISLEAPVAGTAPDIHLRAIADGLEKCGHEVSRVWGQPSVGARRILSLITFQLGRLRPVLGSDVVYVRWHVLLVAHILLARAMRRPYVLEVNGTDEDIVLAHGRIRRLAPLLRRITRWQFAGASHVIAVSPGLGEWVTSLTAGTVPVTVMANGAPGALALRRRAAEAPPYAAFVGELATWQGLDTVLEARRSPDWPTELSLVVVGSGTEQEAVEAAAKEGLVDFRGRLERDEAFDVLAGATVSISVQTGRLARNQLGVTPLKVAESLMLGVPVVVSDLRGQAELVRSSPASLVIQPDDPMALAVTLQQVVRGVYDRAAVSDFAEAHVSWERVAERTAAICASCR